MRESERARKLRANVPAMLLDPHSRHALPLIHGDMPQSYVAYAAQRWLVADGVPQVRLDGAWDFTGYACQGHDDVGACVTCLVIDAGLFVQHSIRQRTGCEYAWLKHQRGILETQLDMRLRERLLSSLGNATDTGSQLSPQQVSEVERELAEVEEKRLGVVGLVARRLTLPVRCGLFESSDERGDSVFMWRLRERGVSRLIVAAVAGLLLSSRAYVDVSHADLPMVERRVGRRSNYVADQIAKVQGTHFGRFFCA